MSTALLAIFLIVTINVDKICLISYHRYENGSKFDDVINTFSYDLREYLYGGEN